MREAIPGFVPMIGSLHRNMWHGIVTQTSCHPSKEECIDESAAALPFWALECNAGKKNLKQEHISSHQQQQAFFIRRTNKETKRKSIFVDFLISSVSHIHKDLIEKPSEKGKGGNK